MTLYKGQNTYEVELLPGESRETLFTEQVRKSAYRAMETGNLDPETLSSLVKMQNAGSIQASILTRMLVAKQLIDTKVQSADNLSKNTRGNAGPGFGKLELGPFIDPNCRNNSINETVDTNTTPAQSSIEQTTDQLRDYDIKDPYNVIEDE